MIMNYNLIIEATGAKPEQLTFSTKQSYPIKFTACELDFTIHASDAYGLAEYQISFIPKKEIKLHSVTVQLLAADNRIGKEYPIYVYDNGMATNTFTKILKLEADATEMMHSRDLVTMHNENGDLNLAFTTFNRFYTELHTNCEGTSGTIYLEDKPVTPGEEYILEALTMDEDLNGLDFFEQYTQLLHDRHKIGPMKPIPVGWSSWSCLYGSVNEEDVTKQAKLLAEGWKELGADLIQIDDGWQKEGSFGAYWTHNDKFPHDISWLVEKCKELGLRFGIWMGPGFVIDISTRWDELEPYLNRVDGKLIRSFGGSATLMAEKCGAVYPLDISKEESIELAREMFRRGVKEYGAEYFKIDFIVNLLVRAGNGFTRVEYPNGYAVELYKHYMNEIRKVVGEDVFLLACGAPVGESIGIYDSIRISHDIAWGNVPGFPGAWNVIRNDAQCAILRSPYHDKVFINDPDALLVRDFQNDRYNDEVVLTLEEAKMWATTVAMSGGHILINEELDKLSQERKDLFTNILPPLGLAARPYDFYEYPWCSETFTAIDEDTQLHALYNWGDDVMHKTLKNPCGGEAVLVDCWSHEIIGCIEDTMEFTLPSHTCRAFLIKRLPGQGGYLYNDRNFNLGVDIDRESSCFRSGRSYYYFPCGAPEGYDAVANDKLADLYVKQS